RETLDNAVFGGRSAYEDAFEPELGNYLGVAAGPAPGAMTDYLNSCADSLLTARDTIQTRAYLAPEPPDLAQRWRNSHWELTALASRLLGYAALQTNDPATMRDGLENLLDAVR